MEENRRYFLKRPNKKRRGFALVCYVLPNRNQKQYLPLAPSLKAEVDQLNKQLRAGALTEHEVEALLKNIIERQYRKANVRDRVLKNTTLSEVNQKTFKRFWTEVYGLRYPVDEAAARAKFLKALRLIEPLSVQTASALELQNRLKETTKKANELRYATDRLNQILKFLKRDVRLHKPKAGMHKIQYLTKAELDLIVPHIRDAACKDLAVTLFCSGLRLGEALALTEGDFVDGRLNITKQLTRAGEVKLPKREIVGRVVVFPFGRAAVERWLKVEERLVYHHKLFDELAYACDKAFPGNQSKLVGPHDLRHSHAIHLLGQGASLTQVALNLRNTIQVCQRFYTGYVHSDDSSDALVRLLKS